MAAIMILPLLLASGASAVPAAAPINNGSCVIVVPGTGNPLDPVNWGETWTVKNCLQTTAAAMTTNCDITIYDTTSKTLFGFTPLILDVTQVGNPNTFIAPVQPKDFATKVLNRTDLLITMACGTNGMTTALEDTVGGAGLAAGKCITGNLGQFTSCNGAAFYAATQEAIRKKDISIPALALSPKNNRLCYTSWSCPAVDMDPVDNPVGASLLSADMTVTAQFTKANVAARPNDTSVIIGSDFALVHYLYDSLLDCQAFTIPDVIDGMPRGTMASENLFAFANELEHPNRLCEVPDNDPFVSTQNNGVFQAANLTRQNQIRTESGQQAVNDADAAAADGKLFCAKYLGYATDLFFNCFFVSPHASPMPAVASNLCTFLTQRFSTSYTNLGCPAMLNIAVPFQNFMSNPASKVIDGLTFTAKSATPATYSASDKIASAFFSLGQLCDVRSDTIIVAPGTAVAYGENKLAPNECSSLAVLDKVTDLQEIVFNAISTVVPGVVLDEPHAVATMTYGNTPDNNSYGYSSSEPAKDPATGNAYGYEAAPSKDAANGGGYAPTKQSAGDYIPSSYADVKPGKQSTNFPTYGAAKNSSYDAKDLTAGSSAQGLAPTSVLLGAAVILSLML